MEMTTERLDRILNDMLDACLVGDVVKYSDGLNILTEAKAGEWLTREDYNAGLERLQKIRPEDMKGHEPRMSKR